MTFFREVLGLTNQIADENAIRCYVKAWMRINGWTRAKAIKKVPSHYTDLLLALYNGPFPFYFRNLNRLGMENWAEYIGRADKPPELQSFWTALACFVYSCWHNIRPTQMGGKEAIRSRWNNMVDRAGIDVLDELFDEEDMDFVSFTHE